MLKIRQISQLEDSHQIRKEIDLSCETLVVSDLQTKLDIQRSFLSERGFLEDRAVLRAHELWLKILVQVEPTVKVISPSLARSLIMQWLERDRVPWARTTPAAHYVFQLIQQFLPILYQPNGEELMVSWLSDSSVKDHSRALIRWGAWFKLAHQYWDRFQELQLLPSSWVSAYLASVYANDCDSQVVWDRKIILDLGCNFTPVESHLLQQMQEKHEIEVLEPHSTWADEYSECLLGYHFLKTSESLEKNSLEKNNLEKNNLQKNQLMSFSPKVQFLRFSTMVSEIKAVTAKVRQWLDSGARLEEINLLAPDIEVYWTTLRFYFEQEGIPLSKAVVTPLISQPVISRWLSALRIGSGKVQYEDLEAVEFSKEEPPEKKLDSFKQLFKNIYSFEELKGLARYKRFSGSIDKKELLNRDEFVAKSFHLWPTEDTQHLEKLYQSLFQDSPPYLQLKWNQWIMYVEELCAKIEIPISPPSLGVHFANIQSGTQESCKYLYVMGVCESSLRPSRGTSIEYNEVLEIHRDTGYMIDFSGSQKKEFELRWALEGNFQEVFVGFSASDFFGEVQGPSRLWLQGAMGAVRQGESVSQEKGGELTPLSSLAAKHEGAQSVSRESASQERASLNNTSLNNASLDLEQVHYPDDSRWDEIQKASIEKLQVIRKWSEEIARVHRERETLHDGLKNISLSTKPTLSVTQLENYSKCPFIFAAHKLFHLSDLPDMDVDINPMTRGHWMHLIFQELTTPSFRGECTDAELMEVIRSCRQQLPGGRSLENPIWDLWEPSLLKVAQKFIQSELKLRERFPKLQTRGRECAIEADWDLSRGELTLKGEGDYEFKGSIDRVDTNGEREACVVDYKSSGSGLTNFQSWENNNQFQLTIYAQAVARGLTELESEQEAHDVCSAFYYVAKDMSREKGFRMADRGGDLFAEGGRSCKSGSEIEEAQRNILLKIQKIVQSIDGGSFFPEPKDQKICDQCHWRSLCRAPHLN